MTDDQLLTHELTHRHSGNGYAAVEILAPTISTATGKKTEWVRVTGKWLKTQQAFLANRDCLDIYKQSQGTDSDGKLLPPEPLKLTADELAKLAPLRDGLADGSIKIVSTRFEKVA